MKKDRSGYAAAAPGRVFSRLGRSAFADDFADFNPDQKWIGLYDKKMRYYGPSYPVDNVSFKRIKN